MNVSSQHKENRLLIGPQSWFPELSFKLQFFHNDFSVEEQQWGIYGQFLLIMRVKSFAPFCSKWFQIFDENLF
jgi:hypothetical protein